MKRPDFTLRCVLVAAAAISATIALRGQTGLNPEALGRIEFRSIGPSLTTGRLSDIAVDPKNPNVWYVAASAGNLWKTENRGNTWTPNPPYGAVLTYSIGRAPEGGAKIVLKITDDAGRQVRRLELRSETGVHRIAWDLRGEPPQPRQTTEAGASGRGRGGRGAETDGEAGGAGDQEQPASGFGGRGGAPQGAPVSSGRYRAAIGRMDGDTFTSAGETQSFQVIPLRR